MKIDMAAIAAAILATSSSRGLHVASAFSTTRTEWMRIPTLRVRSSLFCTTVQSSSSPVEEEENNDAPVSSSSIYEVQAEAVSKLKSTFLRVMRDRGFLHQCTNIVELDSRLHNKKLSAYLGFDATADSLHVGSLLQIMILRHFQTCGHVPVVLLGGGTSKVGDPTGKDESRKLLTESDIETNTRGISRVFHRFLGDDVTMVNNDAWLSQLKYLDFLREYGTQFTINRMLSFESVKQRLEREAPFTFLEFNYMILQAYDFLELSRRYDVKLQMGGSDQWGNILAGTELARKVDGVQLFGLTAPLITTSDGKKMGKTMGGAVWLNADRLSEYDYWQFWRNTADGDVIRFLKLFTELPLEEIHGMEKSLAGADLNKAKIVLADEATGMLHGRDCLTQIHDTVVGMFTKAGGGGTESLPRVYLSARDVVEGVRYVDLFLRLKLTSSKKEARRLIQGGGARVGETVILDENECLVMNLFGKNKEITLRAGKKRAGVVELNEA